MDDVRKLNINEFNSYKNRLAELMKKENALYKQSKQNNGSVDLSEVEKLGEEYYKIQSELLQNDLSDIPYTAWEDIELISDEKHKIDFSNAKANIDFSIIDYSEFANYKGCKIQNFNKLKGIINSESFDQEIIQSNPSYFLSAIFDENTKQKFYSRSLKIDDIFLLSNDQIIELQNKNLMDCFEYKTRQLVDRIGLNTAIQLYFVSKDNYKAVYDIAENIWFGNDVFTEFDFKEKLQKAELTQIKDIFYEQVRKQFLNSKYTYSFNNPENLPEEFKQANADIFLLGDNVPEDLRERYLSRKLTVDDVFKNISLFKHIPVVNFIGRGDYSYDFKEISDALGSETLQRGLELYPEYFNYIIKGGETSEFINFVSASEKLNLSQSDDAKQQLISYLAPFFTVNNELKTKEQFMAYTPELFPLNEEQKRLIDFFGMENLKKFEQETGFFSHKYREWSPNLEMLDVFSLYFRVKQDRIEQLFGKPIPNVSYEEFKNKIAQCLGAIKNDGFFCDYPDYRWLMGEFRENHPEIFLSADAPEKLQNAFYKNGLVPQVLLNHPEYTRFLIGKGAEKIIRSRMKLMTPGLMTETGGFIPSESDFGKEFISRYGEEKYIQLFVKYGQALTNLSVQSFNNEINNEQTIEQAIRKSIYERILKETSDYSFLEKVPEMKQEFPDVFVDFESILSQYGDKMSEQEVSKLKGAFYNKKLSYSDIKNYPFLKDVLKDKNLFVAFGNLDGQHYNDRIIISSGYAQGPNGKKYSDLELLQIFGNENFLDLCSTYGRYLDGITNYLYQNDELTIRNGHYVDLTNSSLDFEKELSLKDIKARIELQILENCLNGSMNYNPTDAPEFLKQSHHELFLSADAPEELQKYFYNAGNNYPLTFEVLSKHKEWMPYLKDKSIATALLRNDYLKDDMKQFLDIFGDKAIRLGTNRAETVKEMMRSHNVELMKQWYDKTGGKFIPDFVVMQNFNINDADKFLTSASNWSNLMRIKDFAEHSETRDAMLKLAYSFGAFDQDQRGFKKLQELLTGLPKKIDADQGYIFEQIDNEINLQSQKNVFYGVKSKSKIKVNSAGEVETIRESVFPDKTPEDAYQKMVEYVKNNQFINLLDTSSLLNLIEKLNNEKVGIDFSKDIFSQIYRKNDDGSYTLTINSQSCPKSAQAIRSVLGKFREVPMLTPAKAHQLFGAFELKYDPNFRDFLLANMDEIINNPEYVSLVSSVQRQFSDIKAVNSNRALTWDLAISYVQTNKFTSINPGNEKVAEISAIAGYSQADFNTLQQIYNYGKQRTFSSIPRIEKNLGKYTYETLRLYDPLAMAIGTLTDCCQELGNCAEVCMEHSMVDKNGRVFVIKDDVGNIVAQSWVWRNKDVLCFDNIEIPDKAFSRAIKDNPEQGRKGFTDEVYNLYKEAAHDLMETDQKVYQELLESGKITQEQYEGLRLGKITVGLGYNDIAESLKQNSERDTGTVSRPLPFTEPVKLQRGLYTNDSTTQYVLKERDDRKEFDGETLAVHNDSFIEYDDSNFNERSLLSLEKLEIVTKEAPIYLETSVGDNADKEHLVTEIARNYELNPETTKIVMNPNFAIIYDVNGDKLKVGDLLFNTYVDNEMQQMNIENQVVMQIGLALEQIASDKEIDVSALNEKQKEMYAKVTGLTDEMDIERGVGHAR